MSRIGSRTTRVLCLLLLIASPAIGCGDDGSAANDGGDGGAGNNDPGSSAGSSGGGGSSGSSGGACKETALFEPRQFGDDGKWVIGAVRPDLATGDVYFSTGDELYVLPKGATEPKSVAKRPQDIWSDFWLTDDGFLFPSGFQVPLVDTEIAVLYAMPRSGGEPTVQVSAPISSEDGWDYHIQDVVVSGDEVYWLAIDAFTAEPWRTPPEYDRTYYVRKTNWRMPGAPVELYSSKHELTGLLIAAGKAYVDEAIDDSIGSDTVQRIVALDGSGAEAMTAQDRYDGGEVMAGDDQSLIFTRSDVEDFSKFGSFRIAPDGTGEEKLGDVLLLGIGTVPAASRDGKWVFIRTAALDDLRVMEYEPGKGLHEIGCLDVDYHGGIVIGDGEALVGIKHDDTGGTVLRFGL